MAFTPLTADVRNISKLDNYPPDDHGMTPALLKSMFDQGSVDIKDYINETLIPEIDEQLITNEGNADAAAISAAAAAASADNASSSASVASTKAGEASESADDAAAFEGTATAAAGLAVTKSTEAANSASAAAASKGSAETAADNAAASAVTATTKAGEASGSADNAAESEGIATTKAGEALTSANNAAASAATANTKAGEAAASAVLAEAARSGAETAKGEAADIVSAFDDHAADVQSDFDDNALAANAVIDGKVTQATNAATAAGTAQGLAEDARDASISAKNDAVTAKTAAESAKTAAKTSEVNAKTSETNAATSATNAASSASSASGSKADALASKNAAATSASNAATSETKAKTSETNAKTAETGAVAAKTAAESAKSIAVTAKDNAVLAKTDAETAQGIAETAKAGADTAKAGADAARTGAESARDAAVAAKNDAVVAKNAAQSAQTAAETAKGQAETARTNAQTAATTAGSRALDSEAYGAGTRNGVAVGAGDPAYQNNAKYYKDQAGEIVGGDFPTKTEAQGYATIAETNANAYTDTQISAIPPIDISGKADKTYVDNKVKTDVPVGAKFTDTVYSHPPTHPASMITGLPASLPASGGNADTVGGFTVGVNVPAGAKFTDTITTVNGKTGAIVKADIVALGIPAQDTVVDISGKVDKVTGKGLSAEDYTTAEKTKLAGIAANANNYAHPTTAGNKHIPSGGASGQILRYSADGTAVWGADSDTVTTINGKTGAITKADITALGIPAQDTVYAHPANHPPSIIIQDASNRFVTDTEKSTWNGKAAGTHTHTKSQITDFPTIFPVSAHKATHAIGGSDALIDSDIGVSPAVATALGLTGNPQVKDALLKIKDAMDSAGAKAKIETGSYIGAHTNGASNPNSLTFSFVPKLVFISRAAESSAAGQVKGTGGYHALIPYFWLAEVTGTASHYFTTMDGSSSSSTHTYSCDCTLSGDKKTITWYSTKGPFEQLNGSARWVYIAIG